MSQHNDSANSSVGRGFSLLRKLRKNLRTREGPLSLSSATRLNAWKKTLSRNRLRALLRGLLFRTTCPESSPTLFGLGSSSQKSLLILRLPSLCSTTLNRWSSSRVFAKSSSKRSKHTRRNNSLNGSLRSTNCSKANERVLNSVEN